MKSEIKTPIKFIISTTHHTYNISLILDQEKQELKNNAMILMEQLESKQENIQNQEVKQYEQYFQEFFKEKKVFIPNDALLLKNKITKVKQFTYYHELLQSGQRLLIQQAHYDHSIVDYQLLISGFSISIRILFKHSQYHIPRDGNIGKGGFGECKNIRQEQYENQNACLKIIKFDPESPKYYCIQNVIRQVGITKLMSAFQIAPQILQFQQNADCLIFDNCICYKMELCKPLVSNDRYWLSEIKDENLKQLQFKKFQKDINQAVFKLHSLKIVHIDIKPANIVFSNKAKKYLLIDFGLSHSVKQTYLMETKIKYAMGTIGFMSKNMKRLYQDNINEVQNSILSVNLFYNDLYGMKQTYYSISYGQLINHLIMKDIQPTKVIFGKYKQPFPPIFLVTTFLNFSQTKQKQEQFIKCVYGFNYQVHKFLSSRVNLKNNNFINFFKSQTYWKSKLIYLQQNDIFIPKIQLLQQGSFYLYQWLKLSKNSVSDFQILKYFKYLSEQKDMKSSQKYEHNLVRQYLQKLLKIQNIDKGKLDYLKLIQKLLFEFEYSIKKKFIQQTTNSIIEFMDENIDKNYGCSFSSNLIILFINKSFYDLQLSNKKYFESKFKYQQFKNQIFLVSDNIYKMLYNYFQKFSGKLNFQKTSKNLILNFLKSLAKSLNTKSLRVNINIQNIKKIVNLIISTNQNKQTKLVIQFLLTIIYLLNKTNEQEHQYHHKQQFNKNIEQINDLLLRINSYYGQNNYYQMYLYIYLINIYRKYEQLDWDIFKIYLTQFLDIFDNIGDIFILNKLKLKNSSLFCYNSYEIHKMLHDSLNNLKKEIYQIDQYESIQEQKRKVYQFLEAISWQKLNLIQWPSFLQNIYSCIILQNNANYLNIVAKFGLKIQQFNKGIPYVIAQKELKAENIYNVLTQNKYLNKIKNQPIVFVKNVFSDYKVDYQLMIKQHRITNIRATFINKKFQILNFQSKVKIFFESRIYHVNENNQQFLLNVVDIDSNPLKTLNIISKIVQQIGCYKLFSLSKVFPKTLRFENNSDFIIYNNCIIYKIQYCQFLQFNKTLLQSQNQQIIKTQIKQILLNIDASIFLYNVYFQKFKEKFCIHNIAFCMKLKKYTLIFGTYKQIQNKTLQNHQFFDKKQSFGQQKQKCLELFKISYNFSTSISKYFQQNLLNFVYFNKFKQISQLKQQIIHKQNHEKLKHQDFIVNFEISVFGKSKLMCKQQQINKFNSSYKKLRKLYQIIVKHQSIKTGLIQYNYPVTLLCYYQILDLLKHFNNSQVIPIEIIKILMLLIPSLININSNIVEQQMHIIQQSLNRSQEYFITDDIQNSQSFCNLIKCLFSSWSNKMTDQQKYLIIIENINQVNLYLFQLQQILQTKLREKQYKTDKKYQIIQLYYQEVIRIFIYIDLQKIQVDMKKTIEKQIEELLQRYFLFLQQLNSQQQYDMEFNEQIIQFIIQIVQYYNRKNLLSTVAKSWIQRGLIISQVNQKLKESYYLHMLLELKNKIEQYEKNNFYQK